MQRVVAFALVAGALGTGSAFADPLPLSPDMPVRVAAAQSNLGGGFIEFLFNGGNSQPARGPRYGYPAQPQYDGPGAQPGPYYARREPAEQSEADRPAMSAIFRRQVVAYDGDEKPGTVIIDTPRRFLFLIQEDGKALRYGIGVGRPGFTWAGVKQISAKREWPDWRPPDEMLRRRPDLPR